MSSNNLKLSQLISIQTITPSTMIKKSSVLITVVLLQKNSKIPRKVIEIVGIEKKISIFPWKWTIWAANSSEIIWAPTSEWEGLSLNRNKIKTWLLATPSKTTTITTMTDQPNKKRMTTEVITGLRSYQVFLVMMHLLSIWRAQSSSKQLSRRFFRKNI